MRGALLFLAGFLTMLIALSAFGGWTSAGTFIAYGAIGYALFFPPRDGRPWAALVGATCAMELLATARFGAATLYAVVSYGIILLLADFARWTEEYGRFIVAVLLMALCYPLILLSPSHLVGAFPRLFVAYLIIMGLGSLAHRARRKTEYELV